MPTSTLATDTTIKMPSKLHARIKSLAEIRKSTPHSIMLQALETYLVREEKRETFRQEAIAAWEEYQQTGLHLTNDEVKAWLLKLAEGNDVEPPKCHI